MFNAGVAFLSEVLILSDNQTCYSSSPENTLLLQCTTFGFFESLAENRTSVTEAGEVTRLLLLPGGLSPVQAADLYHTLFNFVVSEQVNIVWG